MNPALPDPGTVLAIDRARLLPADAHFNPTLAAVGGGLWMVYRRVIQHPVGAVLDWPRRLAACRLGSDLQPIPRSNVDLSARIVDPPGAHPWHADARLSASSEGLWMTYHDNHSLYAAPWNPYDGTCEIQPKPFLLVGRPRRARERNWGLFEGGAWSAVYTIDPHLVLRLTRYDEYIEARPAYETSTSIPWDADRWGEPHGGSSPVRVGDCWFSFFQSSRLAATDSEQKIYSVGFYGFAAEPPHPIVYMAREPLLSGVDFAPPYSFFQGHAVAYPSGAIHIGGTWLVSLGIHDRTLALTTFDHDRLLAACERLAATSSSSGS